MRSYYAKWFLKHLRAVPLAYIYVGKQGLFHGALNGGTPLEFGYAEKYENARIHSLHILKAHEKKK